MLTDFKIKNAAPKKTAYKLTDGERLYLLVHPNGSKYWQYSYEFAEKERVLSIGKYPLVSLAHARQKRLDAQRLLSENIDPNSEKRKKKIEAEYKDRNSFYVVAEEWRDMNLNRWTPRHADRTWRRLENHVFEQLGKRPVSEIKPMDVLMLLRKIEQAGNISTAHTVLAICRSVFMYGVVTTRLESNPTDNLIGALKSCQKTHFPTLKSPELPEFLKCFDRLQATEQKKIAFQLLLHTAVRTGELRHARWSEVDFKNQEWLIPPEHSKMRREHLVPLSKQTMFLFSRLYELTGTGEWILPNRAGFKHPVMNENAITDMIAAMGYKGRIVGHGFRSLFSTVLNEQSSFSPDAIERQLAHVERNSVRAAYNRAEYKKERRQIMQWWSDFLDRQAGQLLAENRLAQQNGTAQEADVPQLAQFTMSVGMVSGSLFFRN